MANTTPNYNLIKPLGTEKYDVAVPNANMDNIDLQLKNLEDTKIDAEAGKGLSEENYTLIEKNKVANLPDDTIAQLADIAKIKTRKGNIVLIGDSITAGLSSPQNYPFWLNKNGITLTNKGVGGVLISYFITNFSAVIDSLAILPDTAIILIGTNDVASSKTLAQMIVDYKSLISLFVNKGITPVIGTLLPRSDNLSYNAQIIKFNQWLLEFAELYGYFVFDSYNKFANSDGTPKPLYLFDGLHPSILGHQKLAESIDAVLSRVVVDTPWITSGKENLVVNGNFTTDTDANGRADGWSFYGNETVVAINSLINHPTEGKWQQMIRSGGTGQNSIGYYYQTVNIASILTPGDNAIFGIDVDTDDLINIDVGAALQWQTESGSYISQMSALPRCGVAIKNHRFLMKGVVPPNAAKANILLSTYGAGPATIRFGRVILNKSYL